VTVLGSLGNPVAGCDLLIFGIGRASYIPPDRTFGPVMQFLNELFDMGDSGGKNPDQSMDLDHVTIPAPVDDGNLPIFGVLPNGRGKVLPSLQSSRFTGGGRPRPSTLPTHKSAKDFMVLALAPTIIPQGHHPCPKPSSRDVHAGVTKRVPFRGDFQAPHFHGAIQFSGDFLFPSRSRSIHDGDYLRQILI